MGKEVSIKEISQTFPLGYLQCACSVSSMEGVQGDALGRLSAQAQDPALP